GRPSARHTQEITRILHGEWIRYGRERGHGRYEVQFLGADFAVALRCAPHFPWGCPFRVQLVEVLLVLECVHRRSKTVVSMCSQLTGPDQALKRLLHQLFPRAHVVKDLAPKQEEPAVDS